MIDFAPHPPLLQTPAHPSCRATVIIPARNEEQSLCATLDALRLQTDTRNLPLDPGQFEIIVLLNNCTDSSASVVHAYQARHPDLHLHVVERILPPEQAHVGTARRLLMDTAYHRLQRRSGAAILSTDADTAVSPDWITRNLEALNAGADAVGGLILLKPEDEFLLDSGTLHAYHQDQLYQQRVAQLESLLDPDPADPWPRHLQHFGASLACTPAIYALAGGLPPVKPLEDVAFVDALRRVGARLRHAPEVSIVTSARMDGRAEVGLSGQLRRWKEDSAAARPHTVQSAAFLTHRFTALAELRRLWALPNLPPLHPYPTCWRHPLTDLHPLSLSQTDFLAAIDCNRLIDETFHGEREGNIHHVIANLCQAILRVSTPSQAHSGETSLAASTELFATPGD